MKNYFLFATLSLLCFTAPEQYKQKSLLASQPNIVWIVCEDMSPHLGCYGEKVAKTPNLDRLATEGVRYSNVFTTAGVCAPSRNSIITGRYQTANGGHNMRTLAASGLAKDAYPAGSINPE